MNFLLDTQILLWLDGEQAKLSAAAKSACSDTGNILWLSVASAWEMQIKIGLGRLRLRRSLAETIASQKPPTACKSCLSSLRTRSRWKTCRGITKTRLIVY
jgi:PIN domain nuclease of toxin-antitoxin system